MSGVLNLETIVTEKARAEGVSAEAYVERWFATPPNGRRNGSRRCLCGPAAPWAISAVSNSTKMSTDRVAVDANVLVHALYRDTAQAADRRSLPSSVA